MTTPNPEHTGDKRALILLACGCLVIIGGMVAGTYLSHVKVPPEVYALLGSIVTGLLAFTRDIVSAIRASWSEFTNSKTTDLLAGANPVTPPDPTPKDAAEGARQAADAADTKAEQLERQTLD